MDPLPSLRSPGMTRACHSRPEVTQSLQGKGIHPQAQRFFGSPSRPAAAGDDRLSIFSPPHRGGVLLQQCVFHAASSLLLSRCERALLCCDNQPLAGPACCRHPRAPSAVWCWFGNGAEALCSLFVLDNNPKSGYRQLIRSHEGRARGVGRGGWRRFRPAPGVAPWRHRGSERERMVTGSGRAGRHRRLSRLARAGSSSGAARLGRRKVL